MAKRSIIPISRNVLAELDEPQEERRVVPLQLTVRTTSKQNRAEQSENVQDHISSALSYVR